MSNLLLDTFFSCTTLRAAARQRSEDVTVA